METAELVRAYYDAFNRRDHEAFLALLTDDVAHDINQGGRERGKELFRAFLQRMDEHYDEQAVDVVVLATEDGCRAAAEFIIEGIYKKTQAGLPPATGQKYRLPVGAFFAVKDGRITRVSNHYNLHDWIAQVSQ